MVTRRDAPLITVTCLAALFGISLWVISATSSPKSVATVQTSVYLECPQPSSEIEQLHIVVVQREGKLRAECQFYGARGTYTRGRSRQ